MITIQTPQTPPSGTFGAFRPRPAKKSQLPVLIIAAAVLVAAGAAYFVWFYQGGLSLEKPVFQPAPPLQAIDQKIIGLPRLSFEGLDGDFYKSLKLHGLSPVTAGSLGRDNPFIPY